MGAGVRVGVFTALTRAVWTRALSGPLTLVMKPRAKKPSQNAVGANFESVIDISFLRVFALVFTGERFRNFCLWESARIETARGATKNFFNRRLGCAIWPLL